MIKDLKDWDNFLQKRVKTSLKKEKRIKKRITNLGDFDINRRNALYRAQLQRKATRAEISFGYLLAEMQVKFLFQKGFFKPYHMILDFYIPGQMVGFEIDGGYHKTIKTKDNRRDSLLVTIRDIKTYRFTNEEVLDTPQEVKKRLNAIFCF